MADAHTGAVAFIQRFDSALRLNVHVHPLCLDGVYVLREGDLDGDLVFHELSPPDAATVAEVARRTAEKIKKLLVQRGRYVDPELGNVGESVPGDDSHDEPAFEGSTSRSAGAPARSPNSSVPAESTSTPRLPTSSGICRQ